MTGVCIMMPATGDVGTGLRRRLYADSLALQVCPSLPRPCAVTPCLEEDPSVARCITGEHPGRNLPPTSPRRHLCAPAHTQPHCSAPRRLFLVPRDLLIAFLRRKPACARSRSSPKRRCSRCQPGVLPAEADAPCAPVRVLRSGFSGQGAPWRSPGQSRSRDSAYRFSPP